ncbi:hypothetical protein [Streptomyces aureoverticillatus]|uniref:hypothetical protein n=1 Tax=Streptomyces aureoverticillatus TaxID=66871 RepID=UPI0013DC00D8|nr:hypothetical protein [Streptomyces aureoverticillatus]QIB47197.1 hypothetical protein G3H79_33055 [Streptomyces aureoverticillatus]
MSHRARRPQRSTSLRAAAVATAVAGGVLAAPAATAFANDATPKPKPTVSKPSDEDAVKEKRDAAEQAKKEGRPSVAPPRGGVAAGDKPVVREDTTKPTPKPLSPEERKKVAADKAAQAPRGGVAAGERPASGGDGTATLVGSAAGIALLAGASTIVLRRRAAGRTQA